MGYKEDQTRKQKQQSALAFLRQDTARKEQEAANRAKASSESSKSSESSAPIDNNRSTSPSSAGSSVSAQKVAEQQDTVKGSRISKEKRYESLQIQTSLKNKPLSKSVLQGKGLQAVSKLAKPASEGEFTVHKDTPSPSPLKRNAEGTIDGPDAKKQKGSIGYGGPAYVGPGYNAWNLKRAGKSKASNDSKNLNPAFNRRRVLPPSAIKTLPASTAKVKRPVEGQQSSDERANHRVSSPLSKDSVPSAKGVDMSTKTNVVSTVNRKRKAEGEPERHDEKSRKTANSANNASSSRQRMRTSATFGRSVDDGHKYKTTRKNTSAPRSQVTRRQTPLSTENSPAKALTQPGLVDESIDDSGSEEGEIRSRRTT